MSFSGLFAVGVSGVTAFTTSLEAVSNNIANSQTVGFKRARTEFSDLVTVDAPDANGKVGAGVSALNRQLVAEQGSLTRTDNATDLAISGAGFFVVSEEAGAATASTILFTRAGDFSPNEAGDLVNGAGYFLHPSRASAGGGAPTTADLAALETV
ncbi:MAG: flagellar hook basal-body protein, partial [Parvularculaceae bacterium]